jgi:hypothetical protein
MEKSYNKRCGGGKEDLCHKINVENLKQELSKKFSSVKPTDQNVITLVEINFEGITFSFQIIQC